PTTLFRSGVVACGAPAVSDGLLADALAFQCGLFRPRASKQLTVASRHVGAAGPGAPISYCVAAAALGVYSFAGGRLPEEAGLFFGDTSGITKGGSFGCLFSDRKSTRLNSSHVKISYAVFCLKKKTKHYR